MKTPGCDPDWNELIESISCTFVRLRYPEIALPEGQDASERVNAWITRILQEALNVEDETESLSSAERKFLAQATAFEESHPGSPLWYLEVTIGVLYETPGVLSLDANVATYQGAAHGNEWRALGSFSTASGAHLTLADVVDPMGIREVARLAEAEFRRQKDLPADHDLADTNYWFPDDEFYVPKNFALGPDGVVFYFNPTQITSWSEGPTELVIPYADVGAHLRLTVGPSPP